jgi:hypothetical protein
MSSSAGDAGVGAVQSEGKLRSTGTTDQEGFTQHFAKRVANAIGTGHGVLPSEAVSLAKSGLEAFAAYTKSSAAPQEASSDSLKELSNQLAEMQRDPDNLDFAQYARFEMQLLGVLPMPLLKRRAWEVRERFRVVFGEDRYRSYVDSKPPELGADDRDALLADSQMLMKCMSEAYIFALGREREIQRMKRRVFALSTVAWAAALLIWIILEGRGSEYHMIPLLALFGLFGSTISVFRRLQTLAVTNASATDAALELMSLRLGSIGVLVALLSGWVFAMLIGFIFQAGFIQLGDVAPKFQPDHILEPVTSSDRAKLLVFAFISGFAERFVPDVIDRLTQKADAK